MLPPGLDAALAPGTVISGKYRIEGPLGAGNMGVVVAATHVELNQSLAIKVLLPSSTGGEEATIRFLREGRSAAQLTSPHVAKVHDTGRLPSGAPYLVMEFLHGRDLRAHMAEVGRVSLAQAIEWVLQAAHALAEAHARNIVHRDVKPANLFLAETSAGEQIKVLDFGVSKQLDSGEADLTKTAFAVGTPRYMAPEQMRSARFADARGDIWSLGIVLYELTTGEPPFKGDSITSLCFDVMERTPTPPSQLNPELPPAFDEIIARCLEKDPSERFQSMKALANALGVVAPGARSSGLFNARAWESANPAATATPLPAIATDVMAFPPTVTLPASDARFPEIQHPETMQTWDTTPIPRPLPRWSRHMPHIALAVGIFVAGATTLVLFITHRETSASLMPPAPGASSAEAAAPQASSPSVSLAPVEVGPPDPPAGSSAPSALPAAVEPEGPDPTAPSPAASPPASKSFGSGCTPPYTVDERGHQHVKSWCH